MRQLVFATLAVLPFIAAPALAQDATARDLTVEQSSAANASIEFAGSLKVTVATDRQNPVYARGEKVRLFVTTNEDAYITVLNIGPGGQVTQLFPNAFQTDNHVKGGRPVEIGGGASGAHIEISGPVGRELMKVIASDKPIVVIPETALEGTGPFRLVQGGVPALIRNLSVAANEVTSKPRKLVTTNFILQTVEAHSMNAEPALIIVPSAAAPAAAPAAIPVVTPPIVSTSAAATSFPLLVAVDKQTYKPGEVVTLAVTSLQACYLTVIDINAAGAVRQVFPNKLMTNNSVAAYQTALISGGTSPVALKLDGPVGTEQIMAVCSSDSASLFPLKPEEQGLFPLASDKADVMRTLTVTANQPKNIVSTATVAFNVQN